MSAPANLGGLLVIGVCSKCRVELSEADTQAAVVAPEACSFCHKALAEVRQLVAGPPPLAICDECVAQCVDAIGQGRA